MPLVKHSAMPPMGEVRGEGRGPKKGCSWAGWPLWQWGLRASEAQLGDCNRLQRKEIGVCPPTSVCVPWWRAASRHPSLNTGGTREHPWAEAQVLRLQCPCPVVTWQHGALAVSVANYFIILMGLNTWAAFLEYGQSGTWASWIKAPGPALTCCAHLGETLPLWGSVPLTVKWGFGS